MLEAGLEVLLVQGQCFLADQRIGVEKVWVEVGRFAVGPEVESGEVGGVDREAQFWGEGEEAARRSFDAGCLLLDGG